MGTQKICRTRTVEDMNYSRQKMPTLILYNNSGHFYTIGVYIMLYLTNKGEHTTLYKINKRVYIKTSNKLYIYIVIILYSLHMHTHTHTCVHTHTWVHRRNATRGEGG